MEHESSKRIEVKSWVRIYANSFIKQFITKDLAAVSKLEDLGWVFDGKYPTNLKDDIMTVLKSTKGREALDNQNIRDLFQTYGRIKNPSLTIDDTDDLIDFMSNSNEWFNLIFKIQ